MGSVHISIPCNFFETEIADTNATSNSYMKNKYLQKIDIESSIKEYFAKAQQPIAILGNEILAHHAEYDVLNFCNSLLIPFICSPQLKGISNPKTDECNLGSASCYMEGIIGHPVLDDLFANCDLILLIGYRYVDNMLLSMWSRGIKKRVVMISSYPDKSSIEKVNPDKIVYGLLKDTLESMKSTVQLCNKTDSYSSLKNFRKTVEVYKEFSPNDSVSPEAAISILNDYMDNAMLATDIGYYRHYAAIYSQPKEPNSLITDTAISSFGSGLPSAIAAKRVYPDKDVFLLCGDGGFTLEAETYQHLSDMTFLF